MANESIIQLVISGKDEASKVLRDVASETEKSSGVFSAFGKTVAIASAAAAAAVGAFATVAINAFMDAEVVDVKLNQVLKTTGKEADISADEISKLAMEVSYYSGQSDEAIKTGQAMLLQFDGMNKDTLPKATKLMVDLATFMGTDAADAARTLGLVMTEPELAYRKLIAAGITFSSEEKKAMNEMIKAGNAAAVTTILTDALTKSVEGQAEAFGKTLKGQIEITKMKLDDFMESVGKFIWNSAQPLIAAIDRVKTKFMEWYNDSNTKTMFDSLIQAGKDLWSALQNLWLKIADVAVQLGVHKPTWDDFNNTLNGIVNSIIFITKALTDFINEVTEHVMPKLQPFIILIDNIKFANEECTKKINEVREAMGLEATQTSALITILDALGYAIGIVMSLFYAVNLAISVTSQTVLTIYQAVEKLYHIIYDYVSGAILVMADNFRTALMSAQWFLSIINSLIDAFNTLAGKFNSNWVNVPNISGWITEHQTGGMVPGRPGQAVPIIAHGGEMVSNPNLGQKPVSNAWNINVSLNSEAAVDYFFMKLRQKEVASKFGVS